VELKGATVAYGVADFDSAIGVFKSTSQVLQGKDFPAIRQVALAGRARADDRVAADAALESDLRHGDGI
jgi:hypothetical protein